MIDASGLASEVAALRAYCVAIGRRASPQDAEDWAQEAMLLALSKLHQFRPETGLRGLKAWLGVITQNVKIEHLRGVQMHARKTATLQGAQALSAPQALPRGLDAIELAETVAALGTLPAAKRESILLDLEMDQEQAAERLGVALGTVRTRLHRARAELRQRLEIS